MASMTMSSYQLFAWRDAMALASLLQEMHEPRSTEILFDALSYDDLRELEDAFSDEICDLIHRSEGQRPALLRRIEKNHPNQRTGELVLLLAVIGQARTARALEVRDRYTAAMTPGRGNRDTAAAWYQFVEDIGGLTGEYRFPYEVFEAYGANIDWDSPE